MICPHCQVNLLQKERTGQRCSKCGRGFALDPKQNPLQLHDLRLRRLIDRVSDNGQLRYTPTQLWYASGRKTLPTGAGTTSGGAATTAFLLVGLVAAGAGWSEAAPALLAGGAMAVVISIGVIAMRLTGLLQPKVKVRMTLPEFRTQVLGRWARIYDAPPPGMITEHDASTASTPPQPSLAVLCPDPEVLACLHANQVPPRLGAALRRTVDEVPPGVPVALLHDASADGCLFAAQARAALAGRVVVDGGLRPSAAMAAKAAVRLRGKQPPGETISALRAAGGLTKAELDWMINGWWSPVAALRPAALIARVEALVERAGAAADPDRRKASAVGFLTWPTE